MSVLRATSTLVLPVLALTLATGAQAQGKSKDRDHSRERVVIVQQGHPKGPKYKRVKSSDEAVDVTRVVLHEQGYELVRIERRGDARIVYYRRGNMGRGRGKGPIMYMIVRPSTERIVVERAPGPLLAQINIRLGY